MTDGLIVLIQGMLLGIAIAAPVGPIGLLCIRRTLQYGPTVGFATGMGAAVADTIFGAIAAFGMSAVFTFLRGYETSIRIIGGLFLLCIAARTYTTRPRPPAEIPETRNLAASFLIGLAVTLTNPITVVASIALLTGIGLTTTMGNFDAATLVLGVFCGSSFWWLSLSGGVALVRHRISERRLVVINRFTGVALAVFGVWALATAVTAYWPTPLA